MSSAKMAVTKNSASHSSEPEHASLIRNKCACGKTSGFDATCSGCRSKHAVAQRQSGANDFTRRSFGDTPAGYDFSRVPVFASGNRPNDETAPGQSSPEASPAQSKAAEPKGDINFGEENNPRSTTPVVDRVELVSDSAGAVGGYEEGLECTASLNNPGPFNDTHRDGAVANVHQVQFHMSQGRPDDLRALRVVNRTSTGFGKPWTKNGNDGPPLHEYQYTKDKMVIADAPGWCKTLTESAFPIDYKADFSTYAFDPLTNKVVASISYHVEISKTHYSQRNPVNTVSVTGTNVGGAVPSPVKKQK